mmetsp:Transcript_27802/g.70235  ORF Transcript_27802/g.70235 Transcript_27802/m.70235 type:complete len:388 (-) Transcript_27802:170-1333(-)|eukprot:g4008.t1
MNPRGKENGSGSAGSAGSAPGLLLEEDFVEENRRLRAHVQELEALVGKRDATLQKARQKISQLLGKIRDRDAQLEEKERLVKELLDGHEKLEIQLREVHSNENEKQVENDNYTTSAASSPDSDKAFLTPRGWPSSDGQRIVPQSPSNASEGFASSALSDSGKMSSSSFGTGQSDHGRPGGAAGGEDRSAVRASPSSSRITRERLYPNSASDEVGPAPGRGSTSSSLSVGSASASEVLDHCPAKLAELVELVRDIEEKAGVLKTEIANLQTDMRQAEGDFAKAGAGRRSGAHSPREPEHARWSTSASAAEEHFEKQTSLGRLIAEKQRFFKVYTHQAEKLKKKLAKLQGHAGKSLVQKMNEERNRNRIQGSLGALFDDMSPIEVAPPD